MKRLHYFLFAIVLFMSFTTGVEAIRCKYTYNDVTILLKSTDDNVLDTVDDGGNYVWPYKIASGNKITLDNGNCPTVSLIDTNILFNTVPYRRIYKTQTKCINDNPRTGGEEKCTEVAGVLDNSPQSDFSLTQDKPQFDLVGSSANSCDYSYSNGVNTISITATKDGNSIDWSGSSENGPHANFDFRSKSKVKDKMLNNGSLTCPAHLYANVLADPRSVTITFLGVGTEADQDYSVGVEGGETTWQRPNSISSENWNQSVDCPDLFSNEPGSVGDILRTILGYIRVIGPILVVLLSAIDFIKAIFGFDEKAMTNAYRKLIIRLIAAIALFLIPTLIDVMLDFINATTCTLE